MIKINKDNDLYSNIANVIASLFGAGASLLVGSLCNSIISKQDISTPKKGLVTLGKYGLETITMYSVSTKMREEIDDGADLYNEFVDMVDTYKEQKSVEDDNNHYTYKELSE